MRARWIASLASTASSILMLAVFPPLAAAEDSRKAVPPFRIVKQRGREQSCITGELGKTFTEVVVDANGEVLGHLRTIPKGTKFYRWTKERAVNRTARNGRFDAKDRRFFFRSHAATQMFGPGLYVSLSPTDSQNYGPAQLVIETTRAHRVLTQWELNLFRFSNPKNHRVARALGIDGFSFDRNYLNIITLKGLGAVKRGE
jgi:hypothetical protein